LFYYDRAIGTGGTPVIRSPQSLDALHRVAFG